MNDATDGRAGSFSQVTPFEPRSGLLGSSYAAFPIDIGIPVVAIQPDPPSGWLPAVYIATGEGGLSFVPDGSTATFGDLFSFPDAFFLVENQDFNQASPDFPSPGDLTISNLVVNCVEHPEYFGAITSAGPIAEPGAAQFNLQGGGGPLSPSMTIAFSFDWICGPSSGTYSALLVLISGS